MLRIVVSSGGGLKEIMGNDAEGAKPAHLQRLAASTREWRELPFLGDKTIDNGVGLPAIVLVPIDARWLNTRQIVQNVLSALSLFPSLSW